MIKVGTDFSGIGSPEAALKRLGIPHHNVFACDIDKYAEKSFLELNKPDKFYKDITTRDYKEVPQLDLYVAGFPCQSFSLAGKRGGFDDTRGTLFFNVAEFIKVNQPECFILENVKGLLSHDSGKTYQTITDVLTNGGGTLNGQMGMDTIEDGLGYHVYTQVLNTKDYGIPQNRERIFIVGFKHWRTFNFPVKMPLKLKLKDILEQEVNDKYFLSKKMLKFLNNHKEKYKETGFGRFKPNNGNDIARCLRANAALYPTDNTVIAHSLYPRSSKTGKGGTGHLSKQDGTTYCLDTGNNQAIEVKQLNPSKESGGQQPYQQNRVYDINGLSPCLDTGSSRKNIQIKRLPDLKLKVSKRANDTPKEINQYLKDNKKGTIKDIALYLDLPKTKVEHYFRTDNSRAIPNPEVWLKLKELLNFNNKYDKQVTEINQTIGTYESSNRLYDTDGISPTLQTQEQGYYKTQDKIRKLTPLECWRLQGFTDEEFYKAQKVNSDSQLYKQAGNSITVNVMVEILKKIYLK